MDVLPNGHDVYSVMNQTFFLSKGFTHGEFEVICWMTGWAVAGEHKTVEDHHSAGDEAGMKEPTTPRMSCGQQIPHDERTRIGTTCKVILDYGRVLWLQSLDPQATVALRGYVSQDVSPENRLVLARFPLAAR
eukprot:scaffold225_cov388-Prasinococcus_capsulatus_cf.AAC.39